MPPISLPALSMLDLVAVREGQSVAEAIATAARTAGHAEQLGFSRYWLAEHHNMPGIASSATAVLIGFVASRTSHMRIGSGGIMLPNHSPLMVAEAFGTLEALYPGRIDLGLGRAPGTDQATMRALRRSRVQTEDDFPQEVQQLQQLLAAPGPDQTLIAMPGAGSNVPLWLLGSSLFSAQLAARLGLPYAFASHFAPRFLLQALALYRRTFRPSPQLARPYVMIGVPVIAADTDAQAEFLASSTYERVLGILTQQRGLMKPPVHGFMDALAPYHRQAIRDFLAIAAIGSVPTVAQALQQLINATHADELMLVSDLYHEQQRLHSLSLTVKALQLCTAHPAD